MLVVVNAQSGTMSSAAERQRLRDLLGAAGLPATILEVREGSAIGPAVDADPSEVVVAAGGDGTINAVAARLAGAGRTLGVIPGGTLNHFARDLRIPSDLEGAVRVLRDCPPRLVDVAEVNGRLFVNNSSVGLYPQIVREREKFRHHGLQKWVALAGATIRTFFRWPLVRVRVQAGGQVLSRLTPFVFVGNNAYELEGLRLGSRTALDRGKLFLCIARRMSRFGLVRMAVRGLTGGLRNSDDLEIFSAPQVSIRTRRRVAVAVDGEVTRLDSPLVYSIRPLALRVIAP